MLLAERVHAKVFSALHGSSLVYNACWEDPACDRVALGLGPGQRVLVIASAGCNALDYCLCAPDRVHAVDVNPRQIALLELKMAGIRRLDFDDYWQLFGEGTHPGFSSLYRSRLRGELSLFARSWWDARQGWFAGDGWRDSFYFHGLSGLLARLVRAWIDRRPAFRRAVDALLEADSLDHQRAIFDSDLAPALRSRTLGWAISRQTVMSLLGVPGEQRNEVARAHRDGVAGFVRDCLTRALRDQPIWDNYFWSVYLRGRYTRDCCPEYLREGNFLALKGGLVDRLMLHVNSVTGCLQDLTKAGEGIDRFVLLDHMDWMGWKQPEALGLEWAWIHATARPGARAIFRSAHPDPGYLRQVRLPYADGSPGPHLTDTLLFQPELAQRLHRRDRVGTYGALHVADLLVA